MKKHLIALFLLTANQAFAAGHGHGPFYQDPAFWVGTSFVLVVLLIIKPVAKMLSSMLHSRVDNVLTSIQNSILVKNDAQKLLKKYQEKQKNLKAEINSLLSEAKQETSLLQEEAFNKIDKELQQKGKELSSKISLMESNAQAEITNIIVDKTIESIKSYVAKKQTLKTQEDIVDKVIKAI